MIECLSGVHETPDLIPGTLLLFTPNGKKYIIIEPGDSSVV